MQVSYEIIIKEIGPVIHPTDKRLTGVFGRDFRWRDPKTGDIIWFYKDHINSGLLGHSGLDYACPTDTVIQAPFDLTIDNFYYQNDSNSYGTTLICSSKEFEDEGEIYKVQTKFAHLLDFVDPIIGKEIKRGEDIAITNNSGPFTTGPHLHWSIRTLRKKNNGGWEKVDTDNGYFGYYDPIPLIINQSEDMIDTIKVKGKPEIFAKGINNDKLYLIGGWGSYQELVNAGWFREFVEVDEIDEDKIDWRPFGFIQ